MKKTLTYSALAITSIIGISSANAELENTLSVGYAWSSLEKGYTLKGVSLKYLHQMTPELDFITSLSYLGRKKTEMVKREDGKSSLVTENLKYYSLLAGVGYRFEWITPYVAAGLSYSKYDGEKYAPKKLIDYLFAGKQMSLSGMLGLQMSPLPNIVIDTSIEYSKMAHKNKEKIWQIGLGYRF